MARRVGILGGTFDPIHNGHLQAATDAAIALSLDLVLLIPAGDPWQKSGHVVATAEDRYAMALLATIDDPGLDVSRIEVDRPNETYTFDTLTALRGAPEFADAELFFLLGTDALVGLPSWHGYPDLLGLATFVGVTRPGYDAAGALAPELAALPVVEIRPVDASSTQIRESVARGESVADLTPAHVVRYIAKRGLYGSAA